MSSIDPVEFGEMKSNITHTMQTVGEIKGMLTASLDKFETAQDEAERANTRIDTREAIEVEKEKTEAKGRKKMGFIYGIIATAAGVVTSIMK